MPRYDLILTNGTVLDPANGFEGRAAVAIRGGKIDRVEPEIDPAKSRRVQDVSGLWVMPGQIDTHAHTAGLSRNWDPRRRLRHARPRRHDYRDGHGRHRTVAHRRHCAARRRLERRRKLRAHPRRHRAEGQTVRARHSRRRLQRFAAGLLRSQAARRLLPPSPLKRPPTSSPRRTPQRAYVAYHIGTTETGSQLEGLREVPELVGSGRLHVCHVNSYCRGVIADPAAECAEALDILSDMNGRLVSEVYHAVQNGTSGRCDDDGNVMADVPRNCLRLRGYPETREGLRQAILDGYAEVIAQRTNGNAAGSNDRAGEIYYERGKRALAIFDEANTNVGMSFPVNLPSSAFTLTTAKDDAGRFIVDAVSTDGGSHPRNVAIQTSMALVQFGALTPLEMATKLSLTPARMMGLTNKGRFTPGADADITVLDPDRNAPAMSYVAGKQIMKRGKLTATGGTLLITPEGARAAQQTGIPHQIVDLTQSKLYGP